MLGDIVFCLMLLFLFGYSCTDRDEFYSLGNILAGIGCALWIVALVAGYRYIQDGVTLQSELGRVFVTIQEYLP